MVKKLVHKFLMKFLITCMSGKTYIRSASILSYSTQITTKYEASYLYVETIADQC